MRVVWLGMFINDEFKTWFNRPDLTNWGVWITHLCELFQHESDVELHVVAPNFYTNESVSIKLGSVTYHFYKHQFDVPKVTHFWSTNPMNLNKVIDEVKAIVKKINPDLIHVHGSENPVYSAPALELNKLYPCVKTIQRFNFMATGSSTLHAMVVKIEDMMLRQFNYFGVRTLEMEQIIRDRNPDAKLFFHNYPVAWPSCLKSDIDDSEAYDAVFFARVTRDKGIFDLIEATKLIIKERPQYTLRVFGPFINDEEEVIKKAVIDSKLVKNIHFMGNNQDQRILHQAASKARICVLPTHADIVPGTIIESMLMKLPVVSYAVGGMPQLNVPGHERLKLIEKGDIQGLANLQLELLGSPIKRSLLAQEAYSFATEYYSNTKVVTDIKSMYANVLSEI